MKNLTTNSLVLSLLFMGLSQASAKGFTLDAFTSFEEPDDNQTILIVNPNAPLGTTISDTDFGLNSTVFGGQRTIKATKSNNDRGFISFLVSNGVADGATSSAITGTTEIIWDGNDADDIPTDITIDNGIVQQSIRLSVLTLNIGTGGDDDIGLNLEFRDTSNNVATITQILTTSLPSPESLYFAYEDRVEDSGNSSNIDLTQIDYLRFYTSDSDPGEDFQFDLFQTSQFVPFEFSPALGIMLGGGFFGLNILKKRISK